MADPFSAAGTAVGITSLGIQTCQILFRYYSQYRGFHDDIDDVLRRVESLEGILRALAKVQEKVQIDNHEQSSQLRLALKACQEAMERLKKVAESCGASKNVSSYQERLRLAKKRLQWPLKRETLLDTSSNLDKIQDNLTLALSTLGLDLNLQRFDDLESLTNGIGDRTSRIENHVLSQFDALERMQGGLEQLTYYQQEQSSRVLEDVANIRTAISAQRDSTEQKLDLIIQTLAQFQNPSTIPPSFLAETIDTVSNTQPHSHRTLKHSKASAYARNSRNELVPGSQSCQCRSRTRQSFEIKGWLRIHSTEVYDHETHCPQHFYGNFSRTTAARFIVCNRILRYCMLVGWQQSRRSGWNSSIPVLQYRAVVPWNSPVFLMIRRTELMDTYFPRISREQLESGLAIITNGLRQCFRGQAKPTDIDERGRGIASALVQLVSLLVATDTDIDVLVSFLDTCLEMDIPWDQIDRSCSIPNEYILLLGHSYTQTRGSKLIYHLARRFRSWSIDTNFTRYVPQDRQCVYDNISILLKSEEMYDTLDVETPLLESILARTESKFLRILESENAEELASMLIKGQYTSPLASWPIGLEILLSSNRINGNDDIMTELWRQALSLINPESIELLMFYGILPTLLDWYSIHSTLLETRMYYDGRDRYKKMFLQLAQRLRYDSLEVRPDILNETEVDKAHRWSTPYHTRHLTIEAAESLWEAGHWDVDKVARCSREFFEREPSWDCTPLWICASNHELELRKWFIAKGANPYWVHPFYRTTPAHVGFRQAICEETQDCIWKIEAHPLDTIFKIFDPLNRDGCCCYCSKGGCCGIGLASSRYSESYYGLKARSSISDGQRYIRQYIYRLVDKDSNSSQMGSAILRVLTFEKLSFTHTCCHRIYAGLDDWCTLLTNEEAKVIHDIERDEIDLLESLIVDFERAWQQYPGTFAKFIKKVWKPSMKQELEKKKPLDAEEVFRQTGVKLEESTVENDSEDDSTENESTDEEHNDNADDDDDDGYATATEE